jgi:hypothetical protein
MELAPSPTTFFFMIAHQTCVHYLKRHSPMFSDSHIKQKQKMASSTKEGGKAKGLTSV